MADAGIATWNTKYLYDTWRPITVIQSGGDGVNSAVTADPTWTPFLTTPNFPEYVSGHSTFSMAAATVLDSFFGNNVTFTTTEPTTTLSLTYTSFQQAAQEAGMSRVYGGIHFLFSNRDGGPSVKRSPRGSGHLQRDQGYDAAEGQLNNVLPSGASNPNVTITGQATDNLSGVASLEVQIDGAPTPRAIQRDDGQFLVHHIVSPQRYGRRQPYDQLPGDRRRRQRGHAGPIHLHSGHERPTLKLTSPTANGALTDGATLTGTVTGSEPIVCLCYAFDGSTTMNPVAFDPTAHSVSRWICRSWRRVRTH